jgi:hypothetical protein
MKKSNHTLLELSYLSWSDWIHTSKNWLLPWSNSQTSKIFLKTPSSNSMRPVFKKQVPRISLISQKKTSRLFTDWSFDRLSPASDRDYLKKYHTPQKKKQKKAKTQSLAGYWVSNISCPWFLMEWWNLKISISLTSMNSKLMSSKIFKP